MKGKTVVAVLTGSNVTPEELKYIIRKEEEDKEVVEDEDNISK